MKKIYVVTGGSSGIGFELVKLLSQENKVYVLSREAESIKNLNKGNVICINTDIKEISQIEKSYQQIADKEGKIEALINCAGIAYEQKISGVEETDYEDIFDTNVKGLIFTTKLFLNIIKHNTGIICNISSIAGIKGFKNWSIYSASKFAVEGFTKSIREEVREMGIRVMSVQPGSVKTNIYKKISDEKKKDFMEAITIARLIINALEMPKDAVIENVFINNAAGDL